MCIDCGGICAVLDRMIDEYLSSGHEEGPGRRFFHPTSVPGQTGPEDTTALSDLIEQAACIGMTPQQLEDELISCSGFAEPVANWVREQKVPNGMVRKIILTNAEMIIRERGAQPSKSLVPG